MDEARTNRRWWILGLLLIVAALAAWWIAGGGASGRGGARAGDPAAAKPTERGGGGGAVRTVPRPDRAAGGAASLAGTVRDTGGAPLAGAWVCADPAWAQRLADDERRARRCATADATGAYRIDGLWAGAWSASAGAPRHVPAEWRDPATRRSDLRLVAGEARAGVDFALAGGAAELTGVTLDITGGPVGGAQVWVSGPSATAACRADSRDDGTFSCWVAPGRVWVSASADGYAWGWSQAVAPGAGVEVFLTPEATIGGIVVEAGSRAPIAGAEVELEGDWSADARVFSGPDGRFRFTRVAPGRYKPTATTPGGYGETQGSVLVGIAQERDDVVIELHPAATVTGRVVVAAEGDAEPSPPTGECSVELSRSAREYRQPTTAGTVVFDAVQPGTYDVRIQCEHETSRRYDRLEVAAAPVEVTWTVDPGVSVRGVVVDDAGRPVADADVWARIVGGDPRAPSASASDRTTADGRFVLDGLRAGTAELSVSSERHAEPPEPTKVEVPAAGDVTLRVTGGGTIEGVVVDGDGAPVARVDVRARGERWSGWGNSSSVTAGDGTFTLRGVLPGRYRVTASRGWGDELRKPGTTDDDLQGEVVHVRAGQTARARLVVERADGAITGRVVDAAGRPVGDAFVKAERESEAAGARAGSGLRSARWGWDDRPAVTDLDGRFTIEGLSPGTYTVLAYRKGGSEASAQGVALGSEVTLTVRPTASLAGTVETGGEPPRELRVTLVDPDTGVSRSERFFLSGGAWSIRDLPAGSYDVTAKAPEGSAELEDVALADGEVKTGVVLTLRALVTLVGRVVDVDTRAPLAGMFVFPQALGGARGWEWRGSDGDQVTDATGRFEVPDVPAGRVMLVAWPKDWDANDYEVGLRIVTATGAGEVDVGDVPAMKRRTARGQRAGDLGLTFVEDPPDQDPAEARLEVATVRKGGPADGSGIVPGDVIVSVDGRDCRGEHEWVFGAITRAPEGTRVALGLARGESVTITLGPPQ